MKNKGAGFCDAVYSVVARIPRGRVATYGTVAEMAGSPFAAKSAGRAMSRCPQGLPWWRVVRAGGALAPGLADEQRPLLEAEGVRFKENGRIDMLRHVWAQ